MSIKNFRSYQLAVVFYRQAERMKCAAHLKSQLLRAASSIPLNLAEGSAKPTPRDRAKFYAIALGSLRECQAVLDLMDGVPVQLIRLADALGACLYRLTHPANSATTIQEQDRAE